MSIHLTTDGVVVLEGICASDEAETLLQTMTVTPIPVVDLRSCEAAHTAIIQVLLLMKPKLLGPPAGSFMRNSVYPSLVRLNSLT